MVDFGVPRRIVSFVMPMGYSFNLDGSTLHLAVASLFVAQAAGVDAAGAGWAHDISSIRDFMRQACVAYFGTVAEFADFVMR